MTPENEAKKQYLLRYRQAEREVQLLMEEKERLLALATKVTLSYSGEAKGSGSGDRMGAAVDKIVQCEEEINEAIDAAVDVRREVIEKILTIPDQTLRQVLRRYYILGMTWEEVAVHMHYSYMHVCRLHGQALAQMRL